MAERVMRLAASDVRPSPRVAARQADARRRILEAARVVVAEQGFAAAQVAVVASVADVAVLDEIRPAAAGHPLLADT